MLEGPRAARVDELEAAVSLANSVFYPDGSGDMGGWLPALFDRANASNLRVILDRQRLVSMAGVLIREASILGAALRIASIGSVCTLESYKGRGLATRLVEDASSLARRQGAQLILSEGVRFVRIHELAGSRLAALSCLPQLFRSYGVDRMCLETTAADAEMQRLCREYGLEAVRHGFQGTVKIIDREGFFRALEGVNRRAQDGPELRVEPGPVTVFRLAGEELRLSTDPELAVLAFGSVECRAPEPAPGALQKALARLFPLPLMHYGLDYI